MKKRTKILATLTPVALVLLMATWVFNDVYLRTAILRTFAKGSWYVTTDNDTIYTMGYYGIRKSVRNGTDFKTLSEQDSFCENTLIARSAVIRGDVIYVLCRSYLPGITTLDEDDYNNGALVVLEKGDLAVKEIIKSDIKYVEGDFEDDKLVISGLQGFDIYDISNAVSPKLVYSYRYPKRKEFQGMDVYTNDDSCYVAMATYGSGFEIWNITNVDSTYLVRSIPMTDITDGKGNNCKGNMIFDLVVDYPYIYTTIAPLNGSFGEPNERRGASIYNIVSNTAKAVEIPKEEWYSVKIGDKEPTFIEKYNNYIVTNFADKGVALFKTDNNGNLVFLNTQDVGNNESHVQPIHVTPEGDVISGNYWWDDIYFSSYFKKLQ